MPLSSGLPSSRDQVGDDRLEVLEVEQREALGVGPVEDQAEARLLGGVQAEHLGQQQRAEVGDRGADRRAGAQPAERVELDRGRRWPASPGRCSRCGRASFSLGSPGAASPERSPLMSATKTGTPAADRPSASPAGSWSCPCRSRRRPGRGGSSSPAAGRPGRSGTAVPSSTSAPSGSVCRERVAGGDLGGRRGPAGVRGGRLGSAPAAAGGLPAPRPRRGGGLPARLASAASAAACAAAARRAARPRPAPGRGRPAGPSCPERTARACR